MAKFPDLTGDGEVTQADILKGRGVYKKGGSVMKHSHGHKPMHKMSHGGDMGGDGRTHRKIEKGTGYKRGGEVMKKAVGGIASNGPAPRMIPGPKPIGPITPMPTKPSPRVLYPGGSKNFDESTGSYRGSPGGSMTFKKGGAAKGGKWIQEAIKKPGALKKSLGVSADKPIPAAKLEKASKAPGKMGQRARLAKTLKGMK